MALRADGRVGLRACKGTLYIVDQENSDVLQTINESWWFEDLVHYNWSDDGNRLKLSARFITGIGPTGTVPFTVHFVLSRNELGRWDVQELEPDESSYVVEPDGMVEITNASQFAALELRERGDPVVIDVDFEQTRLILKSVWLTSGSGKITNVSVARNKRAYFVTYQTEYPRIGTTDMKRSIIYLLVPRDPRYVSFEDPELDARRFDARIGIIDRGSFKGSPVPGGPRD